MWPAYLFLVIMTWIFCGAFINLFGLALFPDACKIALKKNSQVFERNILYGPMAWMTFVWIMIDWKKNGSPRT